MIKIYSPIRWLRLIVLYHNTRQELPVCTVVVLLHESVITHTWTFSPHHNYENRSRLMRHYFEARFEEETKAGMKSSSKSSSSDLNTKHQQQPRP